MSTQDPDTGALDEPQADYAMTAERHLALVRTYLQALEQSATGEALAAFFARDVVQVEYPNRLNPNGATSDLATLLKRAALVPTLLQRQSYEIVSELAQGERVVVEAIWTGVLAIAFGAVPAGSTLKAHFAMFFELEDGRIRTQRNYDCFEPW